MSVTAVNEYATPKLNSSCKIIVNVLDLNDNAPLFEKKIYYAAVVENVPVNTSVTQVKAHDRDKVSYALDFICHNDTSLSLIGLEMVG